MAFQYIFHISDIHIRYGDRFKSRYDEYIQVFHNLINKIQSVFHKYPHITPNNSLIVLTGDIFDKKGTLSNYSLDMYQNLIYSLTQITFVILIPGNHDIIQQDDKGPCILSVIKDMSSNLTRLYILDTTTTLTIDNVGFTTVSITDAVDSTTTCERKQELPLFPTNFNKEPEYVIALFHGTFTNSYYDHNRTTENNPLKTYPYEWTKEFKYLMLGDIHLRQHHVNSFGTLCAYSGSLVQQNFGEDIIDHGFLLWDLHKHSVKAFNVYNPKGFLYAVFHNQKWYIQYRNNNIDIYEAVKLTNFPKDIQVRIKSNNYTLNDQQELIKIFNQYNIKYNILSSRLFTKPNYDNPNYDNPNILTEYVQSAPNNFNDPKLLLDYFQSNLETFKLNNEHIELLSDWISNFNNLILNPDKLPSNLKNIASSLNEDIQRNINSLNDITNPQEYYHSFTIKYMSWNNINCFGQQPSSWINFNELSSNIVNINAPNGRGKSTIFNVICLAIWGSLAVEKKIPIPNSFINNDKDAANTLIVLQLDNEEILIIDRTFKRKSNTNKTNINHLTLDEYNNYIHQKPYTSIECIKGATKSTIDIVIRLIGNMENFLKYSMITQNNNFNILDLENKQLVEFIDSSTGLDKLSKIQSLFNTSLNKYKSLATIISNSIANLNEVIPSEYLTDNPQSIADLQQLKQAIIDLKQQKESLKNNYESIDINIHNILNNKSLINKILNTDYQKQLDDLLKNYTYDIDLAQYEKDKQDILATLNNESPQEYDKLYDDSILKLYESYIYTFKNIPIKPCEYSLIVQEESYIPKCIPKEIHISLDEATSNLLDIQNKFNNHSLNKPKEPKQLPSHISVSAIKNISEITQIILQSFSDIDEFMTYCSNINPKYIKPPQLPKPSLVNTTQKTFEELQQEECDLRSQIDDITQEIDKAHEEQFNHRFIVTPSIPMNDIKNYLNIIETQYTPVTISETNKRIKTLQKILEKNNEHISSLSTVNQNINDIRNQLSLFDEDEQEYNPDCHICCSRPWVVKMQKLYQELDIAKKDKRNINNRLNQYNKKHNIKDITEELQQLQEWIQVYDIDKIEHYKNTLKEWEEFNQAQINHTLYKTKIIELKKTQKTLNNQYNLVSEIIKQNNIKQQWDKHERYILYIQYNYLIDNQAYDIWQKEYNNLNKLLNNAKEELELSQEYNHYINDIIPKINRLNNLKKEYKTWEDYDKSKKIVLSHRLIHDIEPVIAFSMQKEEIQNNILRHNKLRLKIHIDELEDELLSLIHRKTILENTINTALEQKQKLIELIDISKIIETKRYLLDKVTNGFKSYKKWLYDNHVLKSITEFTNHIINSLCHDDTKPFRFGYHVTCENSDTTNNITSHIHWLVQHGDNQYDVSIANASGFQRFVISIAIRMALRLFSASNSCSQFFIDEGFTACDKFNITMVPQFLHNLLQYYESVIVVSHIDYILENVDEYIKIKHNPDETSYIQYGSSIL